MSTTKTLILDFVNVLTKSLADAGEISRIYDEVMIELGHAPERWFVNFAATRTGTASDETDPLLYDLPTAAIELVAVFWAGRQLTLTTEMELEAQYGKRWVDRTGQPFAYLIERQNDRQIRPFPRPTEFTTATSIADQSISPLVVYTENPTTVPDVFKLPLALFVIAREFERESNHRDLPFSDACRKFGQRILTVLT